MPTNDFDQQPIDPAAGWPEVPMLSTQAQLLGGPDGPMNAQAVALAARTKKLNADKADKTSVQGAIDAASAAGEAATAAQTAATAAQAAADGVALTGDAALAAAEAAADMANQANNLADSAVQTAADAAAAAAAAKAATDTLAGPQGSEGVGYGAGTVSTALAARVTHVPVSFDPATLSQDVGPVWHPTYGIMSFVAGTGYRSDFQRGLFPSSGAFRNKIINGNFRIWQRDVTQNFTGYGSDDRWQNVNVGSAKTHTRQPMPVGTALMSESTLFFSRTVITTNPAGAANAVYKTQAIESVRTFAGKKATLSFKAKADAARSMSFDLSQVFGTGGAPSATVTGIGSTKIALTTAWQTFTKTFDVPSIAGKTIGTSGTDALVLSVFFDAAANFDARTLSLGRQVGTFDISEIQIEAGESATAFEDRPPSVEMSLCERFYQVRQVAMGGTTSGETVGTYYTAINFPTMRAVPTVEILGSGNGFYQPNPAGIRVGSATFVGTASQSGNVWFDGQALLTAEL